MARHKTGHPPRSAPLSLVQLPPAPEKRKRTSWTKETRKQVRAGRPKGSKDKIPRTLRQSWVAVCQDLIGKKPHLLQKALERGLMAPPPQSFPYLQLAAAYLDGRPTERVQIEGQFQVQISQDARDMRDKLATMAISMARARAEAAAEAERRALPWATTLPVDAHPEVHTS